MADLHYEHPELAALYDLESGWSADRDFYRALPGPAPRTILEIGCGTGLISRRMAADGHQVTGIDPALAMLDVGRRAVGGDAVTWIEGIAQQFRLKTRFDLAFMTGHAFQVLLDDADIRAALTNIVDHLVSGGRFVFETRNPALPWERMFENEVTLQVPTGPVDVSWRVLSRHGDLIRFNSIYRLGETEHISESTLRFPSREQVEAVLADAGFEIEAVYGDWDRQPFDPEQSREIIFLARKLGCTEHNT